ncbi:MAG: NAD(P)-binding protein, partial [Bacteroidia bacterium]|nr:NAD(P)-binding protein [Bacteroidia bacterium]
MNRKDFIRYTAFGASSLFFSPSIAKLLSTPKKFLSPSFTGKVIVVGAGISGMYAAWLLNEQGIDVTVLEASDVYGGRIKSLKDFSDFPIELGAEHLYNRKSVLYQAAKNQNT